jgi:hypothetical protein
MKDSLKLFKESFKGIGRKCIHLQPGFFNQEFDCDEFILCFLLKQKSLQIGQQISTTSPASSIVEGKMHVKGRKS